MAPYHILIVIISSVIPENLVLLTKSEHSGPKSAHIYVPLYRVGVCLDKQGYSRRGNAWKNIKIETKAINIINLSIGLIQLRG